MHICVVQTSTAQAFSESPIAFCLMIDPNSLTFRAYGHLS